MSLTGSVCRCDARGVAARRASGRCRLRCVGNRRRGRRTGAIHRHGRGSAMPSRVVHFDIPFDEPERAAAFYREAFGWSVAKWGPADYWTMTAAEPGPGAEG